MAAIGFLFGPVGRWLLIGLLFMGWTVYQREQAATKARNECQAEQVQKTLEEVLRQRDAFEAALKQAEENAEIARREVEMLEDEKDKIQQDLGTAGEERCDIPDAITKRLSGIK